MVAICSSRFFGDQFATKNKGRKKTEEKKNGYSSYQKNWAIAYCISRKAQNKSNFEHKRSQDERRQLFGVRVLSGRI